MTFGIFFSLSNEIEVNMFNKLCLLFEDLECGGVGTYSNSINV